MKPSSQEDSPMDMSQTIEEISRLRFLGIAAMGVAAADLGMIGSANAQSSATTQSIATAIKPGTHTSFGSLKQIDGDYTP
jgi:hypothetical protein